MSELKKCPFCGSDAEYSSIMEDVVLCSNIDCYFYYSHYLSAKSWQSRPLEDALTARIAELEGINKAHVSFENRFKGDMEEVNNKVQGRIAELEGALKKIEYTIEAWEREGDYDDDCLLKIVHAVLK